MLDFGLAKALEPIGVSNSNPTESPTLTSPAVMTGIGVILGTAAYMKTLPTTSPLVVPGIETT